MIAIIDYGVGNLFSLKSSLTSLEIEAVVTQDLAVLEKADQIILPGVGAFGDAMLKLEKSGLVEPLRNLVAKGKPLLGICLGMQLLFEKSYEFGKYQGLGFIQGEIVPFPKDLGLKIPQMGWNTLEILDDTCPLVKKIPANAAFYYVHSYYGVHCQEALVATSDYGVTVPGIVQNQHVFGTQFHPEKSGTVGLALLQAFSEVRA